MVHFDIRILSCSESPTKKVDYDNQSWPSFGNFSGGLFFSFMTVRYSRVKKTTLIGVHVVLIILLKVVVDPAVNF